MTKVLLIDDDPLMGRLYTDILSYGNYEVIVAKSGEEGIQKTKSENPQVVLLDIMMPKMSGVEVLKILKQDDQTKHIPVIILTNLADDDILNECKQNGAVSCIIKSNTNPTQFLTELEDCMKRHSPVPAQV
jgi:CheY-like chemotaxis protein